MKIYYKTRQAMRGSLKQFKPVDCGSSSKTGKRWARVVPVASGLKL